jgi:hypothetical protein
LPISAGSRRSRNHTSAKTAWFQLVLVPVPLGGQQLGQQLDQFHRDVEDVRNRRSRGALRSEDDL